MSKEYKIGIRHYYNGKLAPHLIEVPNDIVLIYYPIYVQLSYKRKATVFRSEFFPDPVLYTSVHKSQYEGLLLNGLTPDYNPQEEALRKIVSLDSSIIQQTIYDVDSLNFSFQPFHNRYKLYSKDLSDLLSEYFDGLLVSIDYDDKVFFDDLKFYKTYKPLLKLPPRSQINVYSVTQPGGEEFLRQYLQLYQGILSINTIYALKDIILRAVSKVIKKKY